MTNLSDLQALTKPLIDLGVFLRDVQQYTKTCILRYSSLVTGSRYHGGQCKNEYIYNVGCSMRHQDPISIFFVIKYFIHILCHIHILMFATGQIFFQFIDKNTQISKDQLVPCNRSSKKSSSERKTKTVPYQNPCPFGYSALKISLSGLLLDKFTQHLV